MAKKWARQRVRIWNPDTGTTYMTSYNKMNTPDGLELRKYDKKLKKHAMFKLWKKKLH